MAADDFNGTTVNGAVLQSFVRSGPWAVLVLLLLCGIWYEADKWFGAYIASQRQYVRQTSENIVTLQRSMVILNDAVARNTDRFGTVADDVKTNQQRLDALNMLMAHANTMMQEAPERQRRTLEVLLRIEKLLEEKMP
jgi:hypothetical protein